MYFQFVTKVRKNSIQMNENNFITCECVSDARQSVLNQVEQTYTYSFP